MVTDLDYAWSENTTRYFLVKIIELLLSLIWTKHLCELLDRHVEEL